MNECSSLAPYLSGLVNFEVGLTVVLSIRVDNWVVCVFFISFCEINMVLQTSKFGVGCQE